MIKFDVISRFTGKVQFTAKIECNDSELLSVKLGLAVRWAIKTGAYLGGAYLGGAYLGGADLRGADLRDAYLRDADLRGADLRDADLDGADLRGAGLGGADLGGAYLDGAYLCGADLRGADLRDADLRGADLRDAYLGGAYLGGAYLGGAYLGGADLGEQWIVQGPTRSDGYNFNLTNLKDEGVRVKAGCRNFTLAEARAHWQATRGGTALGVETFAILDCLEALAKAHGYAL